MNHLEAVRDAIIKAVENLSEENLAQMPEDYKKQFFAQYRTLRLADVLVAIREKAEDGDFRYMVNSGGGFFSFIPEVGQDGPVYEDCAWNLRTDDLSQQSEECIAFIHSILVDK